MDNPPIENEKITDELIDEEPMDEKLTVGDIIARDIFTVLFGLSILVLGFVVLWWNEGNHVRIEKMNEFISKNTISIDLTKVNPSNNNKLVYAIGKIKSNETLSDGLISVKNSIGLFRDAQMYQWREHTSRYSNDYAKEWHSELIDSSRFSQPNGHQNPTSFLLEPRSIYAKKVSLGAFTLDTELINEIWAVKNITDLPKKPPFKLMPWGYYSGQNPDNPQIGDYKFAYSYTPSETIVSVIGRQTNNHLGTYITPQGKFSNMTMGILSKEDIVKNLVHKNKFTTNLFRILGLLFIWISLHMITAPLTALTEIMPMPIFSNITFFKRELILMASSLLLGITVISLTWISYKPAIAISVLIIIFCFVHSLIKKYKQAYGQV